MICVLFVAPLSPPVTGQSVANDALLAFLRQKHDVISFAGGRDTLSRRWGVGYLLFLLRLITSILRNIRRCNVVYYNISESRLGNAKDLLVFLACLPWLKKFVLHLHGGMGILSLLGHGNTLTRAINAAVFRKVGAIVVLGPSFHSVFSELAPKQAVLHVPNFADDSFFLDQASIVQKFSCTNPLRVLFVSNMLPDKGYHELLSAFELLTEAQRNLVTVDFAGAFPRNAEKELFLQKISAYPQIRYRGFVSGREKIELFACSHVFALPTYYAYEGQPIAILEGYASGCFVLTTNHSGILDIFEDGLNGKLVEKRSAASLAEALQELVRHRGILREVALHNMSVASVKYRKLRFTKQLEEILLTVANSLSRTKSDSPLR